LQDILNAIAAIERFVMGVDFASFAANEEKATAVIKKLEIIGEAVKQVPEAIRQLHPEIPWKAIAGMRDLLVHAYWSLDLNIVWQVIEDDLPSLKRVVSKMVRDRNLE
jgi:uncharacterized protein with HEPN domain